ncbi:hypothetical protein [Actinokineospora enzanensis]|uniref:hypothetical protein n=1 Tax=Actinokineospora enzanensis TaxID=155975 RepID=UPI00036B0129|nr:hypothetical protein [Actinokineospora enzanensis]
MSATRLEIAKLAHLLGADPARFHYLADLSAADVRAVRLRATEVLFAANRSAFERIAAASRLVPSALTAAIAQRTFGPLLSARVAGVLEPERAVDLAGRLPVDFLADVAAQLDPRRAADVLVLLPVSRMVEVAGELVRRHDHITMGRFVGDLPDAALRAIVTALDEESLLRTAVYSESVDRIPTLFALITDTRLAAVAKIFATAADDLAADLYPLLHHLDQAGMVRLTTAVGKLPTTQRETFRKHATAANVLPGLDRIP